MHYINKKCLLLILISIKEQMIAWKKIYHYHRILILILDHNIQLWAWYQAHLSFCNFAAFQLHIIVVYSVIAIAICKTKDDDKEENNYGKKSSSNRRRNKRRNEGYESKTYSYGANAWYSTERSGNL